MKKSQTFLGTSAFALAIAGALATKAGLKNVTHIACYTIGGVSHRTGPMLFTTVKHGLAKTVRTARGIKTLYTASGPVGATVCGKKLYTNPWN